MDDRTMPTITPGPDAFQNAYQAANAGDVVTVAAGKYPRQQVGSGEQDVKAVTFKGEHGAVLEGLDNYASNVVFDGLMLDAGGVQSSGAVFENHGAPGADHVTFRNGAIGNVSDEKGALVAGGYFTFENVAFHDVVLKTDGVHLEGCYAIVVPHFTIRGCTFERCGVMDLFFTFGDWWGDEGAPGSPEAYGDVTIDGCSFGVPVDGYYSVYVGNTDYRHGEPADQAAGAVTGWTVTGNRFDITPTGFDPPRVVTNLAASANTGEVPDDWKTAAPVPPPPPPPPPPPSGGPHDRTMPLATFRCRVSLDQATVRLTKHNRSVGKADVCAPIPTCPREECKRFEKPMQDLVQVDYGQGVS